MNVIEEFYKKFPKQLEETESIKCILKLLGVPEQKEGKKLCIADYLKADKIDIHVPKEIYDQLYISYPPKKLNFIRSNDVTDIILLLPNNEYKSMILPEVKIDDIEFKHSIIEEHIKEYHKRMILDNITLGIKI